MCSILQPYTPSSRWTSHTYSIILQLKDRTWDQMEANIYTVTGIPPIQICVDLLYQFSIYCTTTPKVPPAPNNAQPKQCSQ